MILDLGLIDYEEAYKIQKGMVARRKLGEIDDTLILAEHNNVFTIGRMGRKENLLVDEEYLLGRGVKVLNIDRGGDITFHGPGQLVLYPVVDLRQRRRDLHKYMRDLEEVAIKFLHRYSVQSGRRPGKTGVWSAGKKIASIGIGVSSWITYHGLSVNIKVDLDFFNMIYPCGLKDIEMISLDRLIHKDVVMEEAKERILSAFDNVFNPQTEIPGLKSGDECDCFPRGREPRTLVRGGSTLNSKCISRHGIQNALS